MKDRFEQVIRDAMKGSDRYLVSFNDSDMDFDGPHSSVIGVVKAAKLIKTIRLIPSLNEKKMVTIVIEDVPADINVSINHEAVRACKTMVEKVRSKKNPIKGFVTHSGQMVKEALAAKNMTQLELAERIGRDQSLISRYLSGSIEVSGDTAMDIARELDMHSDPLLLQLTYDKYVRAQRKLESKYGR